MSKKRILFIDDEPFFAAPYIAHLEKTFEVIPEEEALGAIDAVNSTRTWDAIVLDIMMPSPEDRRGITADGLDTGLWVLDQIKATIIAQNIPVVILTSRNIPRVKEFVDAQGFLDGLVSVRPKIETPRFLLPNIIKGVIDKFRPPQTREAGQS